MRRFLPASLIAIACLACALAGRARAEGDRWTLDPVHTRVLVAVDHAGFSKALGTLSGATGTLWFEEGNWQGARVEVEIPLARLDFGDEKWNRATLARTLLDAQAHPVATFASTRVEPVDERQAIVHGVLTLRGVSREVALQVVLNGIKRHPLPPFRRTLGASATATLSRADFGVTAWKSVIGDAIDVRIELEAARARGDAAQDARDGGAVAEPADPVDAASPTDVEPGIEPPPESSPPPDPEPEP